MYLIEMKRSGLDLRASYQHMPIEQLIEIARNIAGDEAVDRCLVDAFLCNRMARGLTRDETFWMDIIVPCGCDPTTLLNDLSELEARFKKICMTALRKCLNDAI